MTRVQTARIATMLHRHRAARAWGPHATRMETALAKLPIRTGAAPHTTFTGNRWEYITNGLRNIQKRHDARLTVLEPALRGRNVPHVALGLDLVTLGA